MSPLVSVSERYLEELKTHGIIYKLVEGGDSGQIKDDFIYVPSIDLHVAKERSHFNEDWNTAHDSLYKENSRMLTNWEFVQFLRHLRADPTDENKQTYEDIVEKRGSWRGEWIDGCFEKKEDGLYILTRDKAIAEKIEDCLMENMTHEISIDDWLGYPNPQGLPYSDVAPGNLTYWSPRPGSAIQFTTTYFRTDFNCSRNPGFKSPSLGVRAAKYSVESVV